MLIFVIIRMRWMTIVFFELSVRNKNCQPHSCYKDSIKQVVPFFEGMGEPTPSKIAFASLTKMNRNKF